MTDGTNRRTQFANLESLLENFANDLISQGFDAEVIASALVAYGLDNLANIAGPEEAANRCAVLWQAFENLAPERGPIQ